MQVKVSNNKELVKEIREYGTKQVSYDGCRKYFMVNEEISLMDGNNCVQ